MNNIFNNECSAYGLSNSYEGKQDDNYPNPSISIFIFHFAEFDFASKKGKSLANRGFSHSKNWTLTLNCLLFT